MVKERNVNLDLIRLIAVISVISVHFFLNGGFYSTPLVGKAMFLSTAMRTFFMICVPLFLMLTGFLMNKKELSKKYYKGIKKTLFLYVASTVIMLIYMMYYKNIHITPTSAIKNILSYSQYSWYIAMYIGLFLLIPFLNLIYNGLDTKGKKLALITTLFSLTVLPTITNSASLTILPVWWTSLYPITYYFLGAYISEYKDSIKLPLWLNFVLIFIVVIGCSLIKFTNQNGLSFLVSHEVDWHGYMTFFTSLLTFLFLVRLNLKKLPKILKKVIAWISELSLGIYLISWIFDDFFYKGLSEKIPTFQERLPYFFLMTTLVFISSFVMSLLINLLYKGICKMPKLLPNKNDKKGVSL